MEGIQDQLIRQLVMCDKTSEWRYILAALVDRKSLVNIKFNLLWTLFEILFHTLFESFWENMAARMDAAALWSPHRCTIYVLLHVFVVFCYRHKVYSHQELLNIGLQCNTVVACLPGFTIPNVLMFHVSSLFFMCFYLFIYFQCTDWVEHPYFRCTLCSDNKGYSDSDLCVLKTRFEFICTPRYLYSETTCLS